MTFTHGDRIKRLAHMGNAALLDLMPMNQPLKDVQAEHDHKRALILLSTACLGNSQAALYLVLGLRLWEADIIIRSIFEGTVKFAYMLESPSTLPERCDEYSNILPMISKLRWHGKSAEALAALGDNGEIWKQPFREMILSEEELSAIREKYPRELRQSVERKWGYTQLVTAISKPGGAFGPTGRSALHNYMVSSHLAHMSNEGIEMPWERGQREQVRREAIELAHAARIVSDCFELTFFRAITIRKFLARSMEDLTEVRTRHTALFDELKSLSEKFSDVEYRA